MNTIVRRRHNPVADVLDWFGGDAASELRAFGLAPYVRIEDYVEGDTYVLRAEMPGVDPDKDVELNLRDDVLTIRGERRQEEKDRNRHEFHYGSFERSIQLPPGTTADDIVAKYADGVLEVRVPYRTEPPEAHRIPVQRTES
ncbi:MAG TPA: Hsp20/alpha crystallin family protein [Nocardioides sp.]